MSWTGIVQRPSMIGFVDNDLCTVQEAGEREGEREGGMERGRDGGGGVDVRNCIM